MGLKARLSARRGRARNVAPEPQTHRHIGAPAEIVDLEVTDVYETDRLGSTLHTAPGDRQAVNVNLAPPAPVYQAPVYAETVVYDDYVYRKVIQAIWFITGLFEVLLALRFLLRVLAANPENPFAVLIYTVTAPLVWPFATLVGAPSAGGSVFEWSTIFAMLVYWLIAWLITKLIDLFWDRPVVHEHRTVPTAAALPVEYVNPVYPPVDHGHQVAERVTRVRRDPY